MSGNETSDLHWSRRVGASVSIPIFQAQIPANIARAKLDLEDAQARREATERNVENDVRTSILSLQNAEARVAAATDTVNAAEEALTIARDRKGAGFGSSIEVDRAEESWRQANEDLIAARADAALALYSLRHATGDLTPMKEAVP
jgi:outer membrane protein TolC